MKRKIKRIFKRTKKIIPNKDAAPQDSSVPRITNETVAEHREEVLGSARKYIYPLQHSKHRIVLISTGLFLAVAIAFTAYCVIALYQLQTNSAFVYRVTQVIPFPVARIGGKFVAYENYLFELRHYTHYYETQQKTNFADEKNRQQLEEFKKRALAKVVDDAYIKKLAKEKGISVSNREVDDQITVLRSQNRLGSSDKVFEDVLKDYWGWSLRDFKRSLKQEILTQKVAASLDSDNQSQADAAVAELQAGADFGTVAKKYSDDPDSKDKGGEIPFAIDRASRDISPAAAEALFKLKPGEISGIINTGYSLEIYKNIETNGDKIRAARIVLDFKPISDYLNDRKEQQKPTVYLSL